jgi:hypothetical protein
MAELASKPADKNVNNARPTSSDSSSKDYIKYIYIFLQQIIPSPNLIFFFLLLTRQSRLLLHASLAFILFFLLFFLLLLLLSMSLCLLVLLPLDCVVVSSSCCLAPIGASLFLRSFDREDCLNACFRVDQRYISKLHPSIHPSSTRAWSRMCRLQTKPRKHSLSFPPLLWCSRRSRSACLPFPADVRL